MSRQEDVKKAISETILTESEIESAIWEAKTAKMHRLSHGEEFRKRYPEHDKEDCPNCGFPIDNRFVHSCRILK